MKGNMIATWKMSFDGIKEGIEVLKKSQSIHEAIVCAVKNVEDNENYVSVGYGGLPNFDGEVELDAAYMNGDTLGIGGIIAVQNIKNPIEVAYDLSKYKRNFLLAGNGAMRYAHRRGFTFHNMLTEKTNQRYLEQKKSEIDMELLEAYGGHDTVCVLGRDQNGTMACGVSTSGLFLKLPGRVGDSPIVGSGFYSDSQIGSAAATGVGEDIMKGCLSFSIVERIRFGMDVQKACETALQDHIDTMAKRGHKVGSMSVIAMDNKNNVGAATNKREFPFVIGDLDGGCHVYVASKIENNMNIFKPDEKWLNEYKGD